MRTYATALLTSLLLLLVAAVPARADDGTVNQVAQYTSNGVVAEIDTYTEKDVVVAVLAFKANGVTQTFAFDRNDWPAVERLWNAARDKDGNDYVSIGSLAEVGTTEKCVLLAAGGPMVRLTIVSPIAGALTFNLPREQVQDFDAKLRQAASVTTAS
ncbi:MAG: hypothetical protein KGL29_01675 [Alphaproteobacteria bacterium]|nr:hypothetical protein [Alphaproteobacteria bacterium]MDE2264582.1 hypothetical protein [Alphaproteobacteria bacterium]MDE2500839.1 hypothetical protein [Alphaproteobacteria bacterium]